MPDVEDPVDSAIAPVAVFVDPEVTIGATVDTPLIGVIEVPGIELFDDNVDTGASRVEVFA